jgi:hypothetical protein
MGGGERGSECDSVDRLHPYGIYELPCNLPPLGASGDRGGGAH